MTELLFYDAVTPETAKAFLHQLHQVTDTEFTLRINSPGGSVFDAYAMYNAIANHPAKVTAEIDGLAASAASFLAMAADEIRIAENGMIMVHLSHGVTVGNRIDHEQQAAVLGKIDEQIAGMYAARTGQTAKAWLKVMEAETWYSAKEAKAAGLVDKINKPAKVKACFDPTVINFIKDIPDAAKPFFAYQEQPALEVYEARLAALTEQIQKVLAL